MSDRVSRASGACSDIICSPAQPARRRAALGKDHPELHARYVFL